MITPAFGLTATERVLPKLALDFTTASLDSRITFTRTTGASNPATYVNSSGYITAATNNQPRFDYDPVTLACKGLLIEESRTNTLKGSDAFSNATYWSIGGGTPSVSADAVTSPDGTANADKLIASTSSGRQSIYQTVTGTAVAHTLTVYAKQAGYTFTGVSFGSGANVDGAFFNLATGIVGTVAASTTASISNAGNGWYRCSITRTLTAATYYPQIECHSADNQVNWTGNGSDGIYIWGAQLEAGAFPTSYIPTTTAALTRNADVATMTGTNFSDWYTAGTGAFNCAVLPKSATGTKPVLQFDDATALNTIAMHGNATSVELKITTLSVLQSTLSTGTITANTAYGSCGAWTAGSNALSKSGGVAITGSPVSIPTVTQSRLGSDGTNYFNGWLQKINYWPQRLTNSEVQAFSK